MFLEQGGPFRRQGIIGYVSGYRSLKRSFEQNCQPRLPSTKTPVRGSEKIEHKIRGAISIMDKTLTPQRSTGQKFDTLCETKLVTSVLPAESHFDAFESMTKPD